MYKISADVRPISPLITQPVTCFSLKVSQLQRRSQLLCCTYTAVPGKDSVPTFVKQSKTMTAVDKIVAGTQHRMIDFA